MNDNLNDPRKPLCNAHPSRAFSLLFLIIVFGVLTLLSLLSGCGHNQCVYLDGTEFSLGGAVVWRTGKILTVNCREQATTKVNTNATAKENGSTATTDVIFSIADQKNGYNTLKIEKEE